MGSYTKPINQLPLLPAISPADQIPVFADGRGGSYRIPFSAFQAALNTPVNGIITQFWSPSASPFTFTFPSVSSNMWLVLTPTGTMAVGILVIPGDGVAIDHQVLDFTTTQAVSALTITAAGSTVTGAPAALTANQTFRLRYEGVSKTWYIAP